MNALQIRAKEAKAQTRRQREIKENEHKAISDTTEAIMYASAMVLHDFFGFGTKRLQTFCTETIDTVNSFAEYYGVEYLFEALKHEAKKRGIEFEVK